MSVSAQPLRASWVTSAGVLHLARILLVCALGLDLYLVSASWHGGALAGCGPDSNCHTVLNSRWAYWLDLPVSWPAALVYSIAVVATLRLRRERSASREVRAWQILIPCSTAIIAAALWFTALQVFVLGTICPYCLTAHSCGLIGAGLLLATAPIRRPSGQGRRGARPAVVPPGMAGWLGLGGLVAVGVLAAGQVLRPPKSYVSVPIKAGVTTTLAQTGAREFLVLDGRFRFDLDQVPLIGRPSAPHTIVSLFDYTCHHCREMHGPLLEVRQQFSNQLAIISLPMPLDEKCNPVVRRTLPPHTNACALARLGLIVWLANRQAARQFDDWVFAPPQPPAPQAAEQFARQLVGDQAFDRAMTNGWLDRQIRQDTSLYEALYRQYGKSYMPEVLIGTNLISGVFNRERLFGLISEQFGLTAGSNSTHAAQP